MKIGRRQTFNETEKREERRKARKEGSSGNVHILIIINKLDVILIFFFMF